MDLDTLTWLRSPDGAALLDELAGQALDEAALLGVVSRLRTRYAPEQARAAVELTLLRRRARAKFLDAERLFFTREALEQASAAPVAAQRAARLAPYGLVGDLGCGIGGDTLALAGAGAQVLALERDELRLAMARANAEARGLAGQVRFVQADLAEGPPPAAALFCDPARRSAGRRRFHVEAYEPPLAMVLGWRRQTPALAVKLAPGVSEDELAGIAAYELEFVSLDGELKEARLWCGPLAETGRRATLLQSLPGTLLQATSYSLVDQSSSYAAFSPPLAYLYEPDPAVIRAGLVRQLAEQLGAAQLDQQIAYLTANQLVTTPFARAWRVLEWQPFSLKRLRARLRTLDAGAVTVKKRGSPLDTDALAHQLSGRGATALTVVLTRVADQPAMLICEGKPSHPAGV